MEYDFRNRPGPQYASSPPPPPSNHLMYGQAQSSSSLYPRVGQPSSPSINHVPNRQSSFHHSTPPPSSTSSGTGMGIRVAIKAEYRITPPPQLSEQTGDIPKSNFNYDFDLERKIFAEAEKEIPNWSWLRVQENPSIRTQPTPSLGTTTDPIVSKYIASGLSREAVPVAVANYGDNPTKVKEFVNGYTLLREMGFSSNSVAEALLMYDNDTDKALSHFLNNSS